MTDQEIKKIVEEAIEGYFEPVYTWEDEDSDPENPSVISSEYPPSDGDYDYASIIDSFKIDKIEITSRNEEEIEVEVSAKTKLWYGSKEEAKEIREEDLSEEFRTIYISIVKDDIDHEWFVYSIEE